MPTYNEAASDYEWGYSGLWNTAQSSVDVQYTADSGLAFIKFSGLTSIQAAVTISSATLHLSFSLPSGTAVVHVYGGKTDPPALPGGSGWSGAYTIWQDYRSSANPSFDADGLTSYDLNVAGLLAELVSDTEGDDIVLMLVQPMYSGASVSGLTATLEIEYTLGDVSFVEVEAPEAIIEVEAAAMSAEVHVNATQPEAVIELEAATMSAITPVLVSQPEAIIELEASTPSAITNLAVTQPEAFIELEAGVMTADTSVIATLPEAILELEAGQLNAVTKVIATMPEAILDLEAGPLTAVTKVLASLPEAVLELECGPLAAVVPPVADLPEAEFELELGRHWVAPNWKLLRASKQTVTAAKGS